MTRTIILDPRNAARPAERPAAHPGRAALPRSARSRRRVGVPFLAGTYDERMYEELRLRAQIFEVLTGGEVASDNPEEQDDFGEAEGKEKGYRLVALPAGMVEDLRVKLQVWTEEARPTLTSLRADLT